MKIHPKWTLHMNSKTIIHLTTKNYQISSVQLGAYNVLKFAHFPGTQLLFLLIVSDPEVFGFVWCCFSLPSSSSTLPVDTSGLLFATVTSSTQSVAKTESHGSGSKRPGESDTALNGGGASPLCKVPKLADAVAVTSSGSVKPGVLCCMHCLQHSVYDVVNDKLPVKMLFYAEYSDEQTVGEFNTRMCFY